MSVLELVLVVGALTVPLPLYETVILVALHAKECNSSWYSDCRMLCSVSGSIWGGLSHACVLERKLMSLVLVYNVCVTKRHSGRPVDAIRN